MGRTRVAAREVTIFRLCASSRLCRAGRYERFMGQQLGAILMCWKHTRDYLRSTSTDFILQDILPFITLTVLYQVKVNITLWATVSQPVCLGVKHPSGTRRPDLYYCQRVAGLLIWGALSDERTGLPFTIAAGPRQRSHSRVWVPRDSWAYSTVSDLRFPQPGGSRPRIYIPQEQDSPVISPGNGFPSRRLLRLTGLPVNAV
jgi:hypothetical protein